MNDLLFHKNFGHNVHVNFISNNIMIKTKSVIGRGPIIITITMIISAGYGGPKRGKPAMMDEHTHAHC